MNVQRGRWVAVLLFLIALASLWAVRGIQDDKEALKYIGCAQDLLKGDAHDLLGRYKGYASYVIFLVPFMALSSPALAVLAQAALAVLAAFALARLVERISDSRRAGTITLWIALLCYPYQEWVLTLYTESFFVSIAVLFLERATRPGGPDRLTWILGGVLLFARPNGMLFVLPVIIWRVQAALSAPRWTGALACAVLLLVVTWLPGVPREHLGVIVEGHVICGFPERLGAASAFNGTTIMDAQVFLFHEPAYAMGLFLRRMASLYTLTRSYYSTPHNLALLPLYAVFACAIAGWWRWRAHPTVGLLAAVLIMNTVLIGLTYDEWNGRFLVPLWPILIAFAAMALDRSWKRTDPHMR